MAWYSKFIPSWRKQAHNPEAEAIAINPMPKPSWRDMEASGTTHRDHPYVALTLTTMGETCASAGYAVYSTANGQELEVTDHPFTQLLNSPNSIDTDFELIEKTIQTLDAFGNAYWWLGGDGTGMPAEIHNIDPRFMRIVPDKVTGIHGFVYERAGTFVEFHHLEIVHFRRPNLDDPFYGKPILKSIQTDIEADLLMARYQRNFFDKDVAMPAGGLSLPASLSNDRYQEAKTEIKEEHGGGKRGLFIFRGSVAGEKPEWLKMGLDYTEMEFNKSREEKRKVILEIGGLPLGLLSEHSTEAHSKVAERRLYANADTRLERMARRITKDILPFYGVGFVFKFKSIRYTDATQLQAMKQATEGVLTVDEQRQELFDKEPLEGNSNGTASMVGAENGRGEQGRGSSDRVHESTKAR